jgi:hypothetical protein
MLTVVRLPVGEFDLGNLNAEEVEAGDGSTRVDI